MKTYYSNLLKNCPEPEGEPDSCCTQDEIEMAEHYKNITNVYQWMQDRKINTVDGEYNPYNFYFRFFQ